MATHKSAVLYVVSQGILLLQPVECRALPEGGLLPDRKGLQVVKEKALANLCTFRGGPMCMVALSQMCSLGPLVIVRAIFLHEAACPADAALQQCQHVLIDTGWLASVICWPGSAPGMVMAHIVVQPPFIAERHSKHTLRR